MQNYQPAQSFNAESAARYDANSVRGDEAATVTFLKALAGVGPALEFAIGTGRIALPLAAQGVRVAGIDLSPHMVAQLRGKPGGRAIEVVIGDMAEAKVPGKFKLVYLVFNTLFNLLTQDEQVRCFQNAARHLTDDGVFVVEGGVPAEFYRLRNHQYVDAETLSLGQVTLDIAKFDPVTQRLEETHVTLDETGVRLGPIVTRYSWPAELDLMARIAGLQLRNRFADWSGTPFAATSNNCISVFEQKPVAG